MENEGKENPYHCNMGASWGILLERFAREDSAPGRGQVTLCVGALGVRGSVLDWIHLFD